MTTLSRGVLHGSFLLLAGCATGVEPQNLVDISGDPLGKAEPAADGDSETAAAAGVAMLSPAGTVDASETVDGSASSSDGEGLPQDTRLDTSPSGDSSSGATDAEPTDSATANLPPLVLPNAACESLITDPSVNWRDSALASDQQVVECLSLTLGKPVGFGEKALGGYDPSGNSQLVVITKEAEISVEEQILAAISGDEHAWIVFDKFDFSEETEIGMYRLQCDNSEVLARLDATAEECRDYRQWCAAEAIGSDEECLEQFFNQALNDGDLPIRNPVVGSNKTIDGRMSEAFFRFSGFAIGADSSGEPTQTAESVIITHLDFRGAGHTEDHELDPDMLRSTGASHDIWIHKNSFDLTGDSAFDVKVGAHDITISFNRVTDVIRASLHGSSDSREINSQITTTIHHNAFVTRDDQYLELGNTGRRVTLIRRGSSHVWNNLFVNYRKDVLSVRVDAQLLWEDNALIVKQALQEKDSVDDSLEELGGNLIRDIDRGNFRAEGTFFWFSDDQCTLNDSTQTPIAPASGNVEELSLRYSERSRAAIEEIRLIAGQELVDYVTATSGTKGSVPFNSPLAASRDEVLAQNQLACP